MDPLSGADASVPAPAPPDAGAAATDAKVIARIGRNPGMLDRAARRMQVLHKYTVRDDSPAMSTLLGNVGEEAEFSEADRNRMRLGRLMVLGAGESSLHHAQIELISIIERMDADLKEYWASGDRVRALRIAIQAVKLLGHTRVPQCYPSMFMLAATVLDTFGDLVADRIRETAAAQSPLIAQLVAQGKEPDPALVPPTAVEMCNNWFLKILSIRELLPRVYVELSLMRTYRYVAAKFRIDNMRDVVERLAMQVRGVADPLVAAHARWYVCLRAKEVLSHDDPEAWGESMILCAEDTLQLIANLPPAAFESKGLRRPAYVMLFVPALQWLVDTVARYSKPDVAEQFMERVLRMMESNPAVCHSSIASIVTGAFPAPMVVERIHRFMALIANAELTMTFDVARLHVVANLCHALAELPPPLPYRKSEKMALINHLWEIVNADRGNLDGFLTASRALLRLLAVHASSSQVTVLLGAINDRILEASSAIQTPAHVNDASSARFSSGRLTGSSPSRDGTATPLPMPQNCDLAAHARDIVWTLLLYQQSGTLFSMWALLLPLLQHVRAEERDEFVLRLLKAVPATSRFSTTILDLCRQLHDRLSDETPEAQAADTITTICRAVRQCFAPEDIEQHLRFLSDCRHGLSQLDEVKVTVCEEALKLIPYIVAPQQTGKKVKRSSAKACLAFVHVTVPGINDAPLRLMTAAQSASLAFHHGFVAQAEVLLQLAADGLKDVLPIEKRRDGSSRVNDAAVIRIATTVLGLGAAAPPHAKYGPLYALLAVVDWANDYPWLEHSDGAWKIGCAALALLGQVRAGTLPYAFAKCPAPQAQLEHASFDAAASSLLINATSLVSRETGKSGMALLAAVEATVPLYRVDPSTGRLLQRSLRTLAAGQAPGEASDVAFLRQKVVTLAYAKERLGEDVWLELVDGDDIPAPQLVAGRAAADDAAE